MCLEHHDPGEMSANINVTRPDTPKKILMVAANPAASSVTGWPIGFWWSELTHAYWSFTEAGYLVEIRSPDGGKLEADGYSDPEHDSGYSADDLLSLGFKRSPRHAALLEDTASIDGVDPKDYDGLFLVGGQSPMQTFLEHDRLHRLLAGFYEAGKIAAVVCHATCVLLRTKLSNGELLVKGKTWTGFSDDEERAAEAAVGSKIQPFWIETEARKLEGTRFVVGPAFRELAIRDGRLITGQQQFSGGAVARLVIEALGR